MSKFMSWALAIVATALLIWALNLKRECDDRQHELDRLRKSVEVELATYRDQVTYGVWPLPSVPDGYVKVVENIPNAAILGFIAKPKGAPAEQAGRALWILRIKESAVPVELFEPKGALMLQQGKPR